VGKRAAVLAELAEVILAVERPHPVRVAIDGCSAAGKTTMADELALVLADRTEREIIRVGIDYFKRAPELRTAYPIDSPESYYLDTWDNEAGGCTSTRFAREIAPRSSSTTRTPAAPPSPAVPSPSRGGNSVAFWRPGTADAMSQLTLVCPRR